MLWFGYKLWLFSAEPLRKKGELLKISQQKLSIVTQFGTLVATEIREGMHLSA